MHITITGAVRDAEAGCGAVVFGIDDCFFLERRSQTVRTLDLHARRASLLVSFSFSALPHAPLPEKKTDAAVSGSGGPGVRGSATMYKCMNVCSFSEPARIRKLIPF